MADKFCKDCKHSRFNGEKMICNSPNNSVPSIDEAQYLVTGERQPTVMAMRGASCKALRMRRDPHTEASVCGPEGKWFEAKE